LKISFSPKKEMFRDQVLELIEDIDVKDHRDILKFLSERTRSFQTLERQRLLKRFEDFSFYGAGDFEETFDQFLRFATDEDEVSDILAKSLYKMFKRSRDVMSEVLTVAVNWKITRKMDREVLLNIFEKRCQEFFNMALKLFDEEDVVDAIESLPSEKLTEFLECFVLEEKLWTKLVTRFHGSVAIPRRERERFC
jgi:hypothetical protein